VVHLTVTFTDGDTATYLSVAALQLKRPRSLHAPAPLSCEGLLSGALALVLSR
jgi:hypothetical protein